MKKLTNIFGAFLIASVVLTSCGGEPTACDCADLAIEAMGAMGESFEVMDDPTKVEEITKKWEKKLKQCTDLSETNADFQFEIEECLKTKMSDMF
jgi:hypothetical protein